MIRFPKQALSATGKNATLIIILYNAVISEFHSIHCSDLNYFPQTKQKDSSICIQHTVDPRHGNVCLLCLPAFFAKDKQGLGQMSLLAMSEVMAIDCFCFGRDLASLSLPVVHEHETDDRCCVMQGRTRDRVTVAITMAVSKDWKRSRRGWIFYIRVLAALMITNVYPDTAFRDESPDRNC
ncbi:hypothetical protein VTN96DRAFT_5280 [Rasamsonia emersonii]